MTRMGVARPKTRKRLHVPVMFCRVVTHGTATRFGGSALKMTRLLIRHETRYDYQHPVSFGPHRLMLRPRDTHAMRVVEANLILSQPGATRWVYDALGNCVCWFHPEGQA